jgi:small subunit ribosomal protein S18
MTQKPTTSSFKSQPKRRERLTPTKAATLPATLAYTINYKNVALLRRYIGITGKILPRRVNGLTAKQHRARARAIRQARVAGRLPFVWLTE